MSDIEHVLPFRENYRKEGEFHQLSFAQFLEDLSIR